MEEDNLHLIPVGRDVEGAIVGAHQNGHSEVPDSGVIPCEPMVSKEVPS